VSLWSDLTGALSRGLQTRVQNRAAGRAAPRIIQPGPIPQQASVLPVLGTIGRVLTGPAARNVAIGTAVGSFFGPGRGGNGACPSGWHLAKDGSGRCVRNRRMNFGNARAARRSVRRLKGARKLLRDIEKMMPTKTTRRRAPAGHSAHLHHTGG